MPSVSIAKHGSGYRCVWREGGRGSKRHVSQTRERKVEAQEDAEAIRARLNAKLPLKLSRVRLPWLEVCERWRDSRKAGRYRDEGLEILKELKWATTEDGTPDAVSKLKLGTRRLVNSALGYARRTLKQPVDMDSLDLPYPHTSKAPKSEPDLLPAADTDALVREAWEWSPGNGAIAHLCATYGHRAASLVGLMGDAVNLTNATIELMTKGGVFVKHGLHPKSVKMLKKLEPRKGQPLFLNHHGVPWETGKKFSEWFYHRIGQVALAKKGEPGRKVGYYQTKSAAITSMLEATNNDAKTVASITGHKRPSLLLDVYARTNEERQQRALKGARPAG